MMGTRGSGLFDNNGALAELCRIGTRSGRRAVAARYATTVCGLALGRGRRAIRGAPAAIALLLAAAPAVAQDVSSAEVDRWRASLEDARWTGPMLASNAETLHRGHAYTEPYLFDYISGGNHHPGSLSYLQYGLADSLTIGLQPSFAFGTERPDRRPMVGDLKLLSQLRLTHFTAAHRIPTIALVLQEKLPTGRYTCLDRGLRVRAAGVRDRIGLNVQCISDCRRPAAALASTSSKAFRARQGPDRSVYGTPPGVSWARATSDDDRHCGGRIQLTREWVAALDLFHGATGRTG